jgi:hypothetical protein
MFLSKEASKSSVRAGHPPGFRASFSESSAMKYRLHLLTVAGFLMVSAGLQAETGKKGDTKYVNTSTAQLKADKTASANTVKDLARGTKLKVLDQGDGRWLQVALADNSSVSGWVFFNKLTDDKPKDVQDRLALGGGLKTSDLETGGAIRGLKKASQAYAQKNLNPADRDKATQDIHRIQTFPLTLQDFDKNKNQNLDAAELKLANEEYKRWVQQRLDQFLKDGKLGEYAE